MRKVIMWNMVTLDGFFEGPNQGQIDWFLFDDELEKYIISCPSCSATVSDCSTI